MGISGAIVLYAVIWFMTFLTLLPVRMRSQAEAGEVARGTPASAPADPRIGRKAGIATLIATVIWAAIAAVILSGRITVEHLDLFGRLG